jgi:aminodeoxyfutalosine deaminase
MRAKELRARFVFPVAGPPIPDGIVTVEAGRIASLGRGPAKADVLDLGNAAILPALVNAHVHLDFSDRTEPFGKPGIGFVDWIRLAMAHRREAPPSRERVAIGIAESLRHAVLTLGDIAQPGDWPQPISPLRATVFQELITPTPDRVAAAVELARSHLRIDAANLRPGLSPHAPFSVHPDLLAAAVRLSSQRRAPLAMHLAESREELELLERGTGPLRRLLEELGAWKSSTVAPGTKPLHYLQSLSVADRALVIHGNYLAADEIAFLGANSSRMTVVYCPRTHEWFEHEAYPLEKMLAAGVRVALGTDGRGSSPDLSVLAEMRAVARRHPSVGLDRILEMGTIRGAAALGWDRDIGTLEPGKLADFAVVRLPDRDALDPHELLLRSTEPIADCYAGGEPVERNSFRPNTSAKQYEGTE